MNATTYNSKHKGIHWDKLRSKWFAKININSRSLFLGRFENEVAAIEAREKAEAALSLLKDMNAANIHDASTKRCHKSIAGFISKNRFDYKVELQINGTEAVFNVAGGDL